MVLCIASFAYVVIIIIIIISFVVLLNYLNLKVLLFPILLPISLVGGRVREQLRDTSCRQVAAQF